MFTKTGYKFRSEEKGGIQKNAPTAEPENEDDVEEEEVPLVDEVPLEDDNGDADQQDPAPSPRGRPPKRKGRGGRKKALTTELINMRHKASTCVQYRQ